MKQKPIKICSIKLLPKDSLRKGMQREELINIAHHYEDEYFTPGTAFIEMQTKENTSGIFYEISISWMVPGMAEPSYIYRLIKTGAIVATTKEGRKFTIYQNDYFSNTSFRLVAESEHNKTNVKGSITTTQPL